MVSTPHPSTQIAPGTVPGDRGFIREETFTTVSPLNSSTGVYPFRFGGSVVLGSLLTLSLFAWQSRAGRDCSPVSTHLRWLAGPVTSLSTRA